MNKGKLYLFPTPLHENAVHSIPEYVLQHLYRVDTFIAERAKTARRFLKLAQTPIPMSAITMYELGKYTPASEWQQFLVASEKGKDIGLLSEAGCPGVADPGAEIVQLAHTKGIEVVPLVGPSSILLAVMASGMNGQQFCFNGYLSPKKPQLAQDLKRLEQLSQRHQQTQVFIETPYRNSALVEIALKTLSANTLFGIACDLTAPTQWIKTLSIAQWKKTKVPNLHKRPAIFMLLRK
ncbi:MAG: SAM-dependent methyltransferase [Bacteroidota bacterium]